MSDDAVCFARRGQRVEWRWRLTEGARGSTRSEGHSRLGTARPSILQHRRHFREHHGRLGHVRWPLQTTAQHRTVRQKEQAGCGGGKIDQSTRSAPKKLSRDPDATTKTLQRSPIPARSKRNTRSTRCPTRSTASRCVDAALGRGRTGQQTADLGSTGKPSDASLPGGRQSNLPHFRCRRTSSGITARMRSLSLDWEADRVVDLRTNRRSTRASMSS